MLSKRRGIWLAAVVIGMLAAWACRNPTRGLDWGWRGEREIEPLHTFSHQEHASVFEREQIQCFACHTMTARIQDEQEAAAAIRASHETFVGGKDACHSCHYNPQAGNTAPDRCGLCHLDVSEVAPANHNHDWMARHVVFAKADAQSCEGCHQVRQCQDCHNRRDQTVRSFHDTNIRFTHGIEARANPMRCGQCHTSGFCQRCHVEGGYEK
jgi:hypothetical protein